MTAPINTTTDRWRIGFDIGGTFTDFVLLDNERGSVRLHKRLTTPKDPSIAALAGLQELVEQAGITLSDISEIVHGTTLVTNAVIERKGAKLGLLTTKGFRDALEIGREQRYDIYDLFLEFPDPMVSRDLRREIDERINRDGYVVQGLDTEAVRKQLRELINEGVEAVAVCFLNSYRNPAHEQAVGQIVQAEFPELAVSLSSEVVAEISEYERSVTTCANAYVQPLMDRYLQKLERELSARNFRGILYLMHSAGGLVSLTTARAFPIRLLESGPAGGALATALFGRLAGKTEVIAFDMGGTTAKACLIENGEVEIAPMLEAGRAHRFAKGSGLPIKTPTVDLIEIGAGGGSIAAIDDVGLLKVGPHSAASDPGPACYGLGGTKPTVTDANLVLGYYDPGFFLGGRMALDKDAAARAVGTLAKPLSLSVEEAAWGIHKVVVESMAAAARVHLIEKGLDPRHYAMVGFGGAGPAHACDVARVLGIKQVIIPPGSGAASALGFLTAPLSYQMVRSRPIEFSEGFDAAAVNPVLREMAEEGRQRLVEAGVVASDISVAASADMRLVGQLHDISVPLPAGDLEGRHLDEIRENFARIYSQRYTSVPDGARVEAINFRVRVAGRAPTVSLKGAADGGDQAAKSKGTRKAWFDRDYHDTNVYDRYALTPGDSFAGPAIIEEREATTVIAPGDSFVVDEALNLRISIAATVALPEIVTAQTRLEDAIDRIHADPIALEIMWSRLVTVTEEMWSTVCRTAFSLVISDAQDFACELLDPQGEPIVHSPRAMPIFNLSLPNGVKKMLEIYPSETLRPGDVLICNDPWLLAGHLFDIAVVTPIFRDDTLVGLTATVAHVSDIGGTRNPSTTREIFEEGVQIPPMKLFEAGKPNETLFRILAENVRGSDQVIGDIQAMVAANEIGGKRLLAFMRDYGMGDLRALTAVVQGLSEKAMRDAIRAIPDGEYTSDCWCNPVDERLRIPLKMTVKGDEIELDFEGAPPQLKVGAFNATLSYSTAAATYPLKCILTPHVRGNAGCYRPFTVKIPEGTLFNCSRTAPVSQRTRSGWYLNPTVFRALATALPDRVQAFTGIPVNPKISGVDARGTPYSELFFNGGGQGASSSRDGRSSLLFPTSAGNTSIEMFESRVPVMVIEKSFIQDSGGAGRFRGGLGQRVRFQKLANDGVDTMIGFFPDSLDQPGLFGGGAGGVGGGALLDAEGMRITVLDKGGVRPVSDRGEIVEILLAGGGGFGNPLERDRAAVERDVRLGLVSAEAAADVYGYGPAAASQAADSAELVG
ncbi:5-oxoprolinase (ATP-hydrolyzing)/N-methylhydantoinase A [Sphingobium sp. JAI105]|uniref:hydantoinase B/oxoprolinase family protein n=1 Tax=Sphingobium sp. JAI105 TaxID=2787715 RepID=UPI0018C9B052|nr:5-oxoprolinase (ATP-hydrolyzing)/N-methylhydantoinase A [Sphingobium sp. JAI105]